MLSNYFVAGIAYPFDCFQKPEFCTSDKCGYSRVCPKNYKNPVGNYPDTSVYLCQDKWRGYLGFLP